MKLVLAAALGAATLLSAAPAPAAESHSDTMISLGVHVALLDKLGTDGLRINVNTHAGHVQLAGTVAKRETKELAATVAKTVEGVASVKNDVRTEKEITGSDPVTVAAKEAEHEAKDALLAGKVRLQLMNKMGSDAFGVHTRVANDVVYLSFADSLGEAQRKKAEELARATGGVKKVIIHD